MWRELWNQLLSQYRGPAIGLISGIVLGIIYLIAGFWDMLVFGFIVYLGYYVGLKLERREVLFPFGELYRFLTDRWRMFR